MRGWVAAAVLALALAACAGAPPLVTPSAKQPAGDTAEAGLWLDADRLEADIRQSPALIQDAGLNRYVSGVACKVAGKYCGDMRLYLLREPGFRARALPNGAVILSSGTLLRLGDEAALALVLGRQVGHYANRHALSLAEAGSLNADVRAWVTLALAPSAVPAEQTAATAWHFTADQEIAADRYAEQAAAEAGYDPSALADLLKAQAHEAGDADAAERLPAASIPRSGERRQIPYRQALRPYHHAFLADEVRLRLPTATLRLFRALRDRDGMDGQLAFHWGEVLRLRGWKDDRPAALRYYAKALVFADVPPETHRSLGLVHRAAGRPRAASHAFQRYLEAEPLAADAAMVRTYIAAASDV